MLQFTTFSTYFSTKWTDWLHRIHGKLGGSRQPPSITTPSPAADALPLIRPPLGQLATLPEEALPPPVRQCPVAMKVLHLLRDLDWQNFPERSRERSWPGPTPVPRAAFVAAYLVKLDEEKRDMGKLRAFLVEHPALVWLLGFPLKPAAIAPWGFDAEASLPSRKHFNRVLRELPNDCLQFLLTGTVHCLHLAAPTEPPFGDTVSLDTKHIVAWVRENNPKVRMADRFVKSRQPMGDPDCKLGCKCKENHPHSDDAHPLSEPTPATSANSAPPAPATNSPATFATPTREGAPASQKLPALDKPKGDFYWGYASGVVASRLILGDQVEPVEFVLAEFTQTFDHGDASYFFPLMQQTERNLGRPPRFGALDKAYDTFYVHEYFHNAGGFAAVPWADSAAHKKRFDENGLPLCPAGLPMPLKSTFWQKSNCLVPHQDGRFVCPLTFPEPSDLPCPIAHANALKGGCITTLPTSVGNRIRHQLDRSTPEFKQLYKQRTATERINSQALALGIERPHLRNAHSIANINTLIYVLLNLRALKRLRERLSGHFSALVQDLAACEVTMPIS
jgi:hypothetical protein